MYRVLLISFVLMVLAWVIPNSYPPWLSAYQNFVIFFAGLIALSFLLLCPLKAPVSVLFISLVSFVPILQKYFGVIYFSGDAIIASVYIAGFAAMLLVGYSFAGTRISPYPHLDTTRWLAIAILLGAVLSVWIALRQWFLLSGSIWIADLPPEGRPFANIGQPNNLATLLSMGLAAAIYLYEKRQLNCFSSSMLVLFLLFGVVLTQSRTPWLAAIAMCLFWAWKSHSCDTRLRLRIMLLWVLIFAALVLALPVIADMLMLSSSNPLERAHSLHRWDLYKQFYYAIIYGPLWGYGWNQVSVAQVAVTPIYSVNLMAHYTHNLVLDLFIWNGRVLGAVIVTASALWLGRLAWVARSSDSLFALTAAGFILTHSMLEFPHAYAYFLLPLGLLLGVAQAEDLSAKTFHIPRWLLGGLLATSAGLVGWIWHEYRIIEEDFRLMRFETANIGSLKAEQAAPDVILLTQLREFTRFARTQAKEDMSDEELDWMRKVANRFPYLPSLFRYSYALALNNQPKEAYKQFVVLRELYGQRQFEYAGVLLAAKQEDHPQLIEVIQIMEKSGSK